jgi:hypothetical protein
VVYAHLCASTATKALLKKATEIAIRRKESAERIEGFKTVIDSPITSPTEYFELTL